MLKIIKSSRLADLLLLSRTVELWLIATLCLLPLLGTHVFFYHGSTSEQHN